MDLAMAPKKAAVDRQAKVEDEEALRGPKIETRRATNEVDNEGIIDRERKKKDVDVEYADKDAEIAGKKRKAEREAEEPFKAADDKRRADEQIRVTRASAEEARKNNWRPDEEGFYVDGDGNRVTRSERVEGRTVTVFVKAPKSKVDGVTKGDPNWFAKEELDSINRRIEKASGDMSVTPEQMDSLLGEKRKILQKLGMPADASPGGKPWERKWKAP